MKPHRTIVRPQPWTNVSIAPRLYMTARAGPTPTPDARRCARGMRIPPATSPAGCAARRPDLVGAPPRVHAAFRLRLLGEARHCHPRFAPCHLGHRDRGGLIHGGLQTYAWHAGCSDRPYTTRTRVMSNLLTPTDLQAVTAG